MKGERGSGTVLALGFVAVLVLAGVTATALATVGVARHRAASAADLAVLAAASKAASGSGVACEAARSTAQLAGARITACTLEGAVAEVAVALRPSGWIGTVGEATGRARAGPVERGR